MKFILQPSQLMLIILASWINRQQQQQQQQQQVIEYLRTENKVLKEKLGNQLIVPMVHRPDTTKEIETTERLGGLLRSYCRVA